MNEIFKKIADAAHYANEHCQENRKMVAIIIASPDAQDDNARLLSFVRGIGVNIIDTLIDTFKSEPKLMVYAKSAIAVIEGAEMRGCDGDNCEHCRCDEERGPEVEE